MTRPWNVDLDHLERPAARHLCPMPPGREPPFVFVRQRVLEQERNLFLAGLLLTVFPRRPKMRLKPDEIEQITRVQERLARLHHGGGLAPLGEILSVWTGPTEGRCTATSIQNEAWLRSRMARFAFFGIRLPHSDGQVH